MEKHLSLLIDLDGTMYRGTQAIPDAARFMERVRQEGLRFLFLTNNSSRTPEAVAEHLSSLGIAAKAEEVVTASQAAAHYMAEHLQCRRVYCIGEEGLIRALTEAGLELVETAPEAVVQGIDRYFDYGKLAKAVNFIRSGAASILTNPDLLLPSEAGFLPGAGSIAASIRSGSGKEPIVIGKPSRIMMDYALNKIGSSSRQTLVIGDNLHTDIAAGAATGCRTALILSGVTTRDNLQQQIKLAGVQADIVSDSLLELLPQLVR